MDNVTHTLFGATLARTPLNRAGRGTTAALILASNAPDIDIVTTIDGALSYLEWHRGPTHGPLGVVGSARLSRESSGPAAACSTATGRRPMPPSDRSRCVSIVGVLCHVLMDLPTSYGTRLLSPFDWHWFAVDLMPIIDIYLLAALAACFWFGEPAGMAAAERRDRAVADGAQLRRSHRRPIARRSSSAPRMFGPDACPSAAHRRGTAGADRRSLADPRTALRRERTAGASSKSPRCRRSRPRSSGGSSRSCRTRTRRATSTCRRSRCARRRRRPKRRGGSCSAIPNRWTPAARRGAPGRTPPRSSSASRASLPRSRPPTRKATPPCDGPTCGSPRRHRAHRLTGPGPGSSARPWSSRRWPHRGRAPWRVGGPVLARAESRALDWARTCRWRAACRARSSAPLSMAARRCKSSPRTPTSGAAG